MAFDRSLHTEAYRRDDSVVKRIADRSEIRRGGASSGDLAHGDELPLLIEVENNEDEEASDHDRSIDERNRSIWQNGGPRRPE